MARKARTLEEEKSRLEEPYINETGEFGISQMFANEEDLENARKVSGYHFAQKELDHKADRVDTHI